VAASRKRASGARFVASATGPEQLDELGDVEIAFAGRSNVGKSSLLAAVLGRPKLVRTSRTPGRTQSLNLFTLDDALALVDLPGYGYAKLPQERRRWLERMLKTYISSRRSLSGIVLLVDGRRQEISALDRAFIEWTVKSGARLLVVVTKIDLVPKPRRRQIARRIEAGLALPAGSVLMCSARTGEGVGELVGSLYELRGELSRKDRDGASP
jgi:GTP-binding protein